MKVVLLLLVSLGLLYSGTEGDVIPGGGMAGGMVMDQYGGGGMNQFGGVGMDQYSGMNMGPYQGNGFNAPNNPVGNDYPDLVGNLNDGPSDPKGIFDDMKDNVNDLASIPDFGSITGIDCIDNIISKIIMWFVKLGDLPDVKPPGLKRR